jgi:hypothetical protein
MWLDRQDPATLMISEWVVTEFASALSVKIRVAVRRSTCPSIAAGDALHDAGTAAQA